MTSEHEDLSRYLDGELDFSALPEELQREAAEFERLMETLKRRPIQMESTLREAVMDRVRDAARSPWRRGWNWAAAPRTLKVRPLTAGLAMAAALAAILIVRSSDMLEPRPDPNAAAVETTTTRFVFLAPQASRVAVTGDFVNWDLEGVPLTSVGDDGVWVAELQLPPGVYHYVFVVDGSEWRTDPNAASQVDDGFGQENSVLLVPAQQASEL